MLLMHFKKIEKETENFVSGIEEMKMEHFEDEIPDINNLNSDVKTEMVDEESFNKKLDESKNEQPTRTFDPEKAPPVCQSTSKTKTSDCMFGCPDEKNDNKPQKIGFDEMVMTIEETEKICDLIEEKDRERKEKEEYESLKQQLDLHRKFLIQQKAQDQQIKDLQELVKSMQFTHEMNESAVAKCGKHHDDCLSDKEKNIKKLLLEKEKNRKQVKVNLNFKDFGKDFLAHLLNKMGLNEQEMKNLLDGINSGKLNLPDIKKQLGFLSQDLEKIEGGYMNDGDCPKCKVDLSEYIDRCKIPCYKCRDPAWNCPQDVNRS